MKEILKKYKRQVQIAGGICLIAVLGIGGYVAANQDTAVQTQTEMKKETKSSDQKSAKNDTKDAALEKKTDTKKENRAERNDCRVLGKGADRRTDQKIDVPACG